MKDMDSENKGTSLRGKKKPQFSRLLIHFENFVNCHAIGTLITENTHIRRSQDYR